MKYKSLTENLVLFFILIASIIALFTFSSFIFITNAIPKSLYPIIINMIAYFCYLIYELFHVLRDEQKNQLINFMLIFIVIMSVTSLFIVSIIWYQNFAWHIIPILFIAIAYICYIIYEIIHEKRNFTTAKKVSEYLLHEGLIKTIPRVHLKENDVIHKEEQIQIKSNGKKIFLSYSTLDSSYFRISDIAKILESYPEIDKILYWEADSGENIVEYMERTLKECNVFVLFCSENSLNSKAVSDEWQAAFQLRKKGELKIVPVYEDEKFIPALLTPLLNVKFSKENFLDVIIELYHEILRK